MNSKRLEAADFQFFCPYLLHLESCVPRTTCELIHTALNRDAVTQFSLSGDHTSFHRSSCLCQANCTRYPSCYFALFILSVKTFQTGHMESEAFRSWMEVLLCFVHEPPYTEHNSNKLTSLSTQSTYGCRCQEMCWVCFPVLLHQPSLGGKHDYPHWIGSPGM